MSGPPDKFAVSVDDRTLRDGDLVSHIDHGPMIVDSVLVGPNSKTVQLQSELDNVGLKLPETELQELWGKELHTDPAEIQQQRVSLDGISAEDLDIDVDVKVAGGAEFSSIDRVAIHARDQIVRALQAERDNTRPEYCEGSGVSVDWDAVLETEDDGR